MQMHIKRKPEYGYLYQTKQTLKQRLTRDKKKYYMMIKGSIQEEDTTTINIYAPNK